MRPLTKAEQQLVVDNRRLVYSFVNKLVDRHQTMRRYREDLEQVGMMGLMAAAQKFQPERGFRFSTYATPWIRSFTARARVRFHNMLSGVGERNGTKWSLPKDMPNENDLSDLPDEREDLREQLRQERLFHELSDQVGGQDLEQYLQAERSLAPDVAAALGISKAQLSMLVARVEPKFRAFVERTRASA